MYAQFERKSLAKGGVTQREHIVDEIQRYDKLNKKRAT